jgi:hypothetical protein
MSTVQHEPVGLVSGMAVTDDHPQPGRTGSAGPDVRLLAASELFNGARDARFEVKNLGPGGSDRDVLSGRTDGLPRPCKGVG